MLLKTDYDHHYHNRCVGCYSSFYCCYWCYRYCHLRFFHAVPIINRTERKPFNVLLARDSVPNFPSTSFPEATAARGLVAVKNYSMRWRRRSLWDAITSAPAWEAQAIRDQSFFTYIMIWSCCCSTNLQVHQKEWTEKTINAHSTRPARTQQILYTLTHRIDDNAITLQQFYCATFVKFI